MAGRGAAQQVLATLARGTGTHRLASEYAARRQALAAALPPGALVVVPGHPNRFIAQHIPYPFRQQAELLYLTGWSHPNAVLVLGRGLVAADIPKTGPPAPTSFLFVDEQAPDRHLWDGRVPGVDEAQRQFGVDRAEPRDKLDATLRRIADGRPEIFVTDEEPANAAVHGRLRAILKEAASTTWLQSCSASLDKLRVVKSGTEVLAMRRACDASAKAYRKLIQRCFRRDSVESNGGVLEATVALTLLDEMTKLGIDEYFYPPVVAGATRGLTLHYVKNNQLIRSVCLMRVIVHGNCDLTPNEMVLIDAGGLQEHYGADISRTLPVSGRFTGAQAELYEAVLAVQVGVIEACKTRKASTLSEMSALSVDLMDKELRAIGFNHSATELTSTLYPHAVGHYLGLNVHDTTFISRNADLAAGNVVTVEPGVYVPDSDKFPARFRGLAIRIEDDILFKEDGEIENLTAAAPKSIKEIQALSNQ